MKYKGLYVFSNKVIIMDITYRPFGDYLLPNLSLKMKGADQLTKFGKMRSDYLVNEKEDIFSTMILDGTLISHLLEIQNSAEEMLDRLIEEMKISEGVTEELKASNQLLWVQRMNNIRSRAEEIVIQEIIRS